MSTPLICPTCNLIQLIDRADGQCNNCAYPDGGFTDEELDTMHDEVFELSQEELEAIEKYQRAELRKANVDAIDHRKMFREVIHARFEGNVAEYCHANGDHPMHCDNIARMAGLRSNTWDEERNVVARRERRARKFNSALDAAHGAELVSAGAVALRGKSASGPVSKAEPVKVSEIGATGPESASKTEAEPALVNWARSYVESLAVAHPGRARKLAGSLAFQLSQLDSVPAEVWQDRAKRAFDAKVGA